MELFGTARRGTADVASAGLESISLDAFRQSMDGIFTTSVCDDTIDESPMVYKPMDEIMELIRDTTDVVDIIKPIYNFKASGELPWRKKEA